MLDLFEHKENFLDSLPENILFESLDHETHLSLLLSILISHSKSNNMLERMLALKPNLLEGLSVEVLYRQVSNQPHVETSLFSYLTKSPNGIKLLAQKPELLSGMTFKDLHQTSKPSTNKNLSPLEYLIQSDDGFMLFLAILERNPNLFSEHPDHFALLINAMESHIPLLAKLPVEILCRPLPVGSHAGFVLFNAKSRRD